MYIDKTCLYVTKPYKSRVQAMPQLRYKSQAAVNPLLTIDWNADSLPVPFPAVDMRHDGRYGVAVDGAHILFLLAEALAPYFHVAHGFSPHGALGFGSFLVHALSPFSELQFW